jgi:NAD/NADP transhydrogenase alpha subunit
VALVPDVINKLTRLGFDVVIESGAGSHSQAVDAEYIPKTPKPHQINSNIIEKCK